MHQRSPDLAAIVPKSVSATLPIILPCKHLLWAERVVVVRTTNSRENTMLAKPDLINFYGSQPAGRATRAGSG